jgi:hypothetical protein
MRPGQNKRSRGRNGGGHGGGPQHHNRGPRPPHRIQTFDSNGPNVKIRGNAYQVFERYLAMAREAQSSGDPVAAENFYQHAEHYFRMMQAAGEGQHQNQQRSMTPADTEMSGADGDSRDGREGQNSYGGEGRDDDGGQPQMQPQAEVQVQHHQPPQQPHEGEHRGDHRGDQPGEEHRPYRDEQPPYRDGQPPGF